MIKEDSVIVIVYTEKILIANYMYKYKQQIIAKCAVYIVQVYIFAQY